MNTDGLWSITSSAGAAGMRPSTGCNLPWPCTVRLDRPLAPGWFWTKRRCSCWKCMISCFRTENLENKPFWNLSSCPGPQDNQCCQEGRELSNRLGGGDAHYISPRSAGWGPCELSARIWEKYGGKWPRPRSDRNKSSGKLPNLGCRANSIAGHLARSVWSQQAEMPGCYRSTWWVTQEPSWQDQERGQPRNKERVPSLPVSWRSSWRH